MILKQSDKAIKVDTTAGMALCHLSGGDIIGKRLAQVDGRSLQLTTAIESTIIVM